MAISILVKNCIENSSVNNLKIKIEMIQHSNELCFDKIVSLQFRYLP